MEKRAGKRRDAATQGVGSGRLRHLPVQRSGVARAGVRTPGRFEFQLLLRLQDSLDIEVLLHTFFTQLAEAFGISELRYVGPDGDVSCRFGGGGRYRLAFALHWNGDALGALYLRSPRPQRSNLVRLQRCVAMVQAPLRNARIYRQTMERSQLDALTGLPNRAALDLALEEELSLASRMKLPIGLLVVDIDRFGDERGGHAHPHGDAILTRTAALLRQGMRRNDRLFRSGGDALVLLARYTGADGLSDLAGRVLQGCREQRFESGGGLLPGSVSVGGAVYRRGESGVELLRRAGEALAAAKQQGGDSTVVVV